MFINPAFNAQLNQGIFITFLWFDFYLETSVFIWLVFASLSLPWGQKGERGLTLHYAAIESNRELIKSVKVIALLLLIFGPNMIVLFSTCVKP